MISEKVENIGRNCFYNFLFYFIKIFTVREKEEDKIQNIFFDDLIKTLCYNFSLIYFYL